MENVYDLGIIGAGPAGYTAAIQAASKGQKVILFEKDEIGGVCLNRGCIPTKSILHVSDLFRKIKSCENCGIAIDNINFDWEKIIERKNLIVEKLRKGIELALKNTKVTVIKEEAFATNFNKIQTKSGTIFDCKKIICAMGSSPKIVKGLEFDHKFLLSSDDILNLKKLPESILIIGSGAIGIEWARIMSNFGVDTTIVELAANLLPTADIEVSKRIERLFKAQKIKFHTQTTIKNIADEEIELTNGVKLNPEIILVGVGRTPNNVKKYDGIKYIGDINGDIQLAHFAIKQAIEEISEIKFDKNLIPSVVYGTPEIAWVGKREQDLEVGSYKKSITLLSALGKAQCDSETEGFIKLLIQNNEIVGAHIISAEASSLIQQVLICMQNHINTDKLKETCFAHPTYSEGIFECLFK